MVKRSTPDSGIVICSSGVIPSKDMTGYLLPLATMALEPERRTHHPGRKWITPYRVADESVCSILSNERLVVLLLPMNGLSIVPRLLNCEHAEIHSINVAANAKVILCLMI